MNVWLEIIGWVGSAVLVVSLLQTQLRRLRVLNLIGCAISGGYNAVLQVWPVVALNVVLGIINVYYLIRMHRSRHDAAAYEILWVGNDDSYLRHVLRVHEADIRRFNPDFTHDPQGAGESYLILMGDETVGIVIITDDGDGRGRVLLDYVTPRHRDRSPGEFVFGPEGPIRQRDWREVHTPAGMVEPYYAQLGLRPEGDHYVLDLSGPRHHG